MSGLFFDCPVPYFPDKPQHALLALEWFIVKFNLLQVVWCSSVCLAFTDMHELILDFPYSTTVCSSQGKGPDSAGLRIPLTFLSDQCISIYYNLLSKLLLKFLLPFKQTNCSKFGSIKGCLSTRGIDNVTTCRMTNLKTLEKEVYGKVEDWVEHSCN